MNDAYLTLTLHPSEFPERQREALLAALRERQLPGWLLYHSPAQAQRWLEYHATWSPSRTDPALHALYAQAYREGAAQVGAGGAHVVGVGCGGGTKDADLLDALREGSAPAALHDGRLHYSALDASPALVAEAALQARRRHPDVRVHPLVVDLTTAPALEDWLGPSAPATPRVYTCFGMLPNLHPRDFPAWLASLVRPQDVLLVSANLSPRGLTADAAVVLQQYDNPPAREWFAGVLAELGLARNAYVLTVDARPLEVGAAGEGAWQVRVSAVLREPATLTVYEQTLEFAVGHRLTLFHSLRFTVDAARDLLAKAGLPPQQHWVGAGGEEGVFLCRAG